MMDRKPRLGNIGRTLIFIHSILMRERNMRILKATSENIRVASRIVRNGGLVVYPTDTVYGLGCDPVNADAVNRVFAAKGERKKPLPVLSCSLADIEKIARLSDVARRIAAEFWPGPLTIIVPKKPTLPDFVTCNLDSVGVRIPENDVAAQLIRWSEGFLVGTSANKTGHRPACTASEALEKLGEEVDAILDGGRAPLGEPSTVVDLTTEKPKILRQGGIAFKDILACMLIDSHHDVALEGDRIAE
ncbi:MAG: threonylcarbamoyl-AMP synthase [Candidatus Bathyarchaeota archaeon]|nr:MAG: threonylcarbamoyl-AMP synthase [Candidatus Bathyarchaeota archaeon]